MPFLLLADLAPDPVSSPLHWLLGVAALVGVVFAIRAVTKKKPDDAKPDLAALPPEALQTAEVKRAEADLERVRREREEAENKAKLEAEARHAKEEAARRKAESVSTEIEAAAQKVEAAKAALASADEAGKKSAKAALEAAEAELVRKKKDAAEAARKAEYEASKAAEAAAKANRRADEEAQKAAALEDAKKRAEENAAAELAKQRKIEAESGRTLAEGLAKTRGGFMARLASLVGATTTLDEKFLGELETILFTADIGPRTSQRLMDLVREKLKNKELADPSKVKAALRAEIERIMTLDGTYSTGGMPPAPATPQVIMVVGVNGSGKTTTIGKLAFKERVAGRSVLLGAGDTFRAAAQEQLDVWAARAEVDVVKGPNGGDPASVAFDTVKKAVDGNLSLCIVDTAGRLQTNTGLMDELKKVKRVMAKALPSAPHEAWLVVDGTAGQNALAQARLFHEAVGLTGLVLTKLDGTAKGGVVIGIADELKLPVRYVGVGEKIGDLRPFDPREFVAALFDEGT